jgi:hypothetical protein
MRIAVVVMLAAGCRLGPLGDDVPGASANLLPHSAAVPSVTDNHDLTSQIAANDGLDDAAPDAAVTVPRGTGFSAGAQVRFWAFGAATAAPSPLYQFFMTTGDTGAGLTPIDHPGLVDAVPGDHGYSPLHSLFQVVVTPAYDGQRITTSAALADAIELGLVGEPIDTGTFVATPIVLPGTTLEIADGEAATASAVYGHGYTVGMFTLGGARGVQPFSFLLPSSDVSFLREPRAVSYDASRPIFQATLPAAPPGPRASYTALSTVIDVDLAPGHPAAEITKDSELFVRSASGKITATTDAVASFRVTGDSLLLPLQLTEGQP